MLEKLKNLLNTKPTEEDLETARVFLSAIESKRVCPVSELVKLHGTPTRVFNGTRVDN